MRGIEMKTPLKVGDRVRVYGSSQAGVNLNGYPATVSNNLDKDGWVLIKLDEPVYTGKIPNVSNTFTVHPKQCRKLIKKPRRRVWVGMRSYVQPGLRHDFLEAREIEPGIGDGTADGKPWLEFIEVRKPKAGSK